MTGISGLALVTGASCGVGFALAGQFARRGYDLIVADSYDEIHTAAAALAVFGTDVEPVQVDMQCVDAADVLHRRAVAAPRPVVAAALSTPLRDALFLDGSLDSALELVDVNVRGTLQLARLLADEMVTHDGGGIILTASPADTMAGLDTAVYSATSAFLRAFAETLQDELGRSGVKVAALMPAPGAQSVGGFVDMLWAMMGRAPTNDPADIARHAFETLTSDDKQSIVVWAADAVTSLASRLIPDHVKGPVRQIISPTGEAV